MIAAMVGGPVARKLTNLLGAEGAATLAGEILAAIGLDALKTPDDRVLFGAELVRRGGALSVVGRSIQTQALLHGALASADRTLDGTRSSH